MVPLRTLRGISLHGTASDHLWRKGAKIRGPEAALMMATVGRSAFLGQVDRPGLPTCANDFRLDVDTCAEVQYRRAAEPPGAQALSRRVTGPRSVTQITAGLVGLHATDPATPYLSLWARCLGLRHHRPGGELYQTRSAVRHLAMRRTLWLVNADDLADHPVGSQRPGRRQRTSPADRGRAKRPVWPRIATAGWTQPARRCCATWASTGPTSSTELRAALPELAGTHDPAPGKRWGGEVPLAPRVLTVLSARGDIVRGPNDGAWTYIATAVGDRRGLARRADPGRRKPEQPEPS